MCKSENSARDGEKFLSYCSIGKQIIIAFVVAEHLQLRAFVDTCQSAVFCRINALRGERERERKFIVEEVKDTFNCNRLSLIESELIDNYIRVLCQAVSQLTVTLISSRLL